MQNGIRTSRRWIVIDLKSLQFSGRIGFESNIHLIAERFEARQNICAAVCSDQRWFLTAAISIDKNLVLTKVIARIYLSTHLISKKSKSHEWLSSNSKDFTTNSTCLPVGADRIQMHSLLGRYVFGKAGDLMVPVAAYNLPPHTLVQKNWKCVIQLVKIANSVLTVARINEIVRGRKSEPIYAVIWSKHQREHISAALKHRRQTGATIFPNGRCVLRLGGSCYVSIINRQRIIRAFATRFHMECCERQLDNVVFWSHDNPRT